MSNKKNRRLLIRSKRRLQPDQCFIHDLVERYARSSGLPINSFEAILSALRKGRFSEAIALSDFDPEQMYGDPHEFFVRSQIAAFIKKVPWKDPSLTPEASALNIFHAAERSCRNINRRFLARNSRAVCGGKLLPYEDILIKSRRYIRYILGDEPDLKRIYESVNFGPGASLGVHGQATHFAAKLDGDWTVTPSALPYAIAALLGDFHVRELLCSHGTFVDMNDALFRERVLERCIIVEHNKITMVPKNAKVHRTIAIEPTLNSYLQKGVDVEMRRLLKRDRIDLTDQTLNQRAAFRGSLGGFDPLVTLDLSAASDSMSIQLIKNLLPPAWFNFLDRIRSPAFSLEAGPKRYEKFVSMGNGFCFPLETLIFASFVQAVNAITGHTEKYVYGDDIILRQSGALLLIELLNYCGFRTNIDKTFILGPFRESCGADFLEGINVRPYNLDFIPVSDRDIYKVYNGLRNSPFVVYPEVLDWILSHIPEEDRFVRPISGPPDTAAEVTQDVFLASRHSSFCRGIQSFTWREWIDSPVMDGKPRHAGIQMYGLLRGIMSSHSGTPMFAFRRRTRNGVRFVPSAPIR